MPKLSAIVSAILQDVARARVEADRYSASISAEYEKDKVLKYFPVPRVDITSVTVNFRFAMENLGKEASSPEIVVESDKLKSLREDTLSTVTVVMEVKNYSWTQVDLNSQDTRLLEST